MTTPVCDFCTRRDPEWALPARSFTLHGLFAAASWESGGDWAACSGCKPYIEARDWAGLIDRVIEAHRYMGYNDARVLRLLRLDVTQMYNALDSHISGDIRPIVEADELAKHPTTWSFKNDKGEIVWHSDIPQPEGWSDEDP